jgi:Phr family secreted Rap phosphatase inhibitor
MKKILLSLALLSTLVFGNSTANTQQQTQPTPKEHCQVDKKTLDVERSGCCSWHGGVVGCSGGRQVCADGSLSPSCTCNTIIDPLG